MEKREITKTPKLSIFVLASNRKDTTCKCLNSLESLRKRVDSELIVVDTGCDEQMLAIIVEYADQVVHFTWCNDFAKARNSALEVAHGEWFLYIDDDEWFEETTDIEVFFNSGDYKNYTVGRYAQRNYFDMRGESYEDCWVGRMAELGSDVRYVGKVHETVSNHVGAIKNFNSFVHHYGYVYTSEEQAYQHYVRNETLLKEMLQEDRYNLRWWTHLAQEYWTISEDYKLETLCSEGLDMIKEWNSIGAETVRGTFYVGRILAAQESGDLKKAIMYFEESVQDRRNSSICLAKLFSLAVSLYFQTESYSKCLESIRAYLYIYETVDRKNEDIENGTIFIYGTFGENVYDKVICFLIRIAIMYKDFDTLKEYFDCINWKKTILYEQQLKVISEMIQFMSVVTYDDFFVHMLWRFWERADLDNEFRAYFVDELKNLEENLLNIDLQKWMDGVVEYCETATLEQVIIWDKVIQKIQSVRNVRYDYWNMVTIEVRLRLGENQSSYEKLHNLLQKYIDSQIVFYQTYIIKEEDDESKLSESYLLAEALRVIFQKEKTENFRLVLRLLKDAMEIYPQMKDVIIVYMQLYVRRIRDFYKG